tara:strand:- start:643 stop:834 length:192 start_codon:yes stop_codon:yes gene_type:complete
MADNIYVGSQMSEKELQRLQKLMTGEQLTEREKKRLNAKLKGQLTEREYERIKRSVPNTSFQR